MQTAVKNAVRVGRATMLAIGVGVSLALVLGFTTVALAAVPGDPFKLGKVNTVNAISTLVGSNNNAMLRLDNNSNGASATALDLQVARGKPPMMVNSSAEVQGLNVDEVDGRSAGAFLGKSETARNAAAVDGRSADEIGVNGRLVVTRESETNSDSSKFVNVPCPQGKVVVGTGYDILGGKSGTDLDFQTTDVVADMVFPLLSSVSVEAFEEEPTSASWSVKAIAVCATAP